MFKRILQQQQQFKNGVYIKCGKKGYFARDYKGNQQSHTVKGINMLQDIDYIKVTREYLIKYFAFYYNSVYKVYKDAKYSIKQQPQELKLNHAKAIQELDDKQDRIYYGMDIYSNFIDLGPVIYLIKEVNKVISNKEIS